MKKYLRLLRVKHYIKNFLIFFPLFFSGKFFQLHLLVKTVTGMAAFCFCSSLVYIVNDLRDLESDKRHPVKRQRPLASGAVSVRSARALCPVLLLLTVLCLLASGASPAAWLCCGVYILINLAYSFGLKNMPVIDVVLLGSGYPLRVVYGGFLSGIQVSSWLFLTVLCISFYLALGKRAGEMKNTQATGLLRPVLERYSQSYLEAHMYLCIGLGLVFYSLWAMERAAVLVYSVPLVLVICMKYDLLLAAGGDGDPVDMLFSSRTLVALVAVYVLFIGGVLFSLGAA